MTAGHPILVLQPQRWTKFDEHTVIFNKGIWDSFGSHVNHKIVPTLSLLPGIIAICAVVLRLMWPLRRRLPRWTQPFVQDVSKPQESAAHGGGFKYLTFTTVLGALVAAGFATQTAAIFIPKLNVLFAPTALALASAGLLIAIDRPRIVPYGPLAIITFLLVTNLILVIGGRSILHIEALFPSLTIIFALCAITVILNMPMRAPGLHFDEISPPFANPTSELQSPEDRLTLWQFLTVSWMEPLISRGKSKKLEDEDVWGLGLEFQHRLLHDNFREMRGSVVRRLLAANGIDLVITTTLAVVESAATYSTPIFLQKLLQAMEDPLAPRSSAATFAFLSLLARLVAAQTTVLNLWFCRRCYERSRGEMITMLYGKTLTRRVVGDSVDLNAKEKLGANHVDELPEAAKPIARLRRAISFMRTSAKKLNCFSRKKKDTKDAKQAASVGKILNLMRNDVYEVSQRFWEFPSFVTTPLGLILSVILVWKLIGWPCFLGVVTMIFAQVINAIITKILLGWERKRRAATDKKLTKVSSFVTAIRHLRWYGWQEFWLDQIMESRKYELRLRAITGAWKVLISYTIQFGSNMFPVVAFFAYTVLAGRPLTIDIAFPALQLFNMLGASLREIPDLITTLLNAKIAVDRIEDFMSEPDRQDTKISTQGADFGVKNATFAWPGTESPVLKEISVTFPAGLTIICGKVGAGKSALLQALLGELDCLEGEVIRPPQGIGYCIQSPWLQSMSIRENILFSYPYEEARYREVLDACALNPDFASFKDGDLSNIGENGIGLSGGQRARVALARAVYSRTPILLLDDPLSALDHQTAESIVQKCFQGPLLKGRTVVLVTHRVDLCRPVADQVIEIDDGKAVALNQEAISNLLVNDLDELATKINDQTKADDENERATPDKFIEDEHREHGEVQASVYWQYVKAGKLKFWAILIFILILFRLATVAPTWFLKEWGEAYNRPTTQVSRIHTPIDDFPSPEVNVRPWLTVYFVIGTVQATLYATSQAFMLVIIYTAGKGMFESIMHRVSHAVFRFYDVTPVGRLMNRMTSDISTIDGNISHQFQIIAWLGIAWITNLVIIASVTPLFLVFSFVLAAAFVFIFFRFLPASQSLRRLEMVSLSPLMSNFGTLLEGLTTVRAFCVQSRFENRLIEVVDTFQKMDHFYWSLQAWLMYRFDSLSAVSTFILTLLALYTGVSAGLTAFVLLAAAQFVYCTHALCKIYGRMQMDFVSVERVVELLNVEQEHKGSIDPPAAWPSYTGDIVFENVTLRYAAHLDPSLSNISFRIPAGSTTALLGRTGSGKSTMALSLLATLLPESGRIMIDGLDISQVNTQALRHRVTFLAQDPVLFPGKMRDNLDPLSEHTDEACEAVLQRVCGPHGWTIETTVEDGGKNLSQGQRQLVGLARAVLRRSAIVILDEATASIDMETALHIQQVLREEMQESTVITIAHRLEAVKDADYFIRLDKGRVIEHGPASTATQGSGNEEE